MAAGEVKKAMDNLTCPICYQLFKNPKYLSCHHFYCGGCLEKMHVQSKITCPECRKETAIPAGGVKELDNAFFINRLVDELILKRKVQGEVQVKCDECSGEDPVEAFCPDCAIFMCHICNEYHKRSHKTRDHGIVPLTELKSKKDIPIQPKPKTMLCKEHDIELLFYCETCDQLVCMYCTVKDHASHSHDTVKKMAGKHRQELAKIIASIDKMIKDLSEAHSAADKARKKIKQQGSEIDKKIDQHYDKLIQQIMEQKEQIKHQAQEMVLQREKAVTVQLEEVEFAQAEAVSIRELYSAVEKGYEQELLSMKKHVMHETEQLNVKCSKLTVILKESATLDFVPTKIPFPQFGHLITDPIACTSEVADLPPYAVAGQDVKFTVITKDVSGGRCVQGGRHIQLLHSVTRDFVSAKVNDNNDGSYMVSFVTASPGEMKFLISVDEELSKETSYCITVVINYSLLDKPKKTINNNSTMGKLWSIAFSSNGVWAVADYSKHCVYLFDANDQLVKTLGNSGNYGSANGHFKSPFGITYDEDNNLYVADGGNHRIQKFDNDGNYLLQFGSRGSNPGQFGTTWGYGCTTHNDKVYVADSSNKCIRVFTTVGKFCLSIGRGKLASPYGVTVSHNNHLLVADYSHNSIYRFTLDGNYIDKFGTKGTGQGEFDRPYSLTTDIYGFIFVTDTYNHRISIFDKDGNFVHCFGSKGSDHGQFNAPVGIALTPTGSIYISDHNNHRVQIYVR
ncbi:tripartite motif-containing protein 2-like [Dysidea avara]|uniref:tripartite motif-containing protein 2-like n=1 Tax=Dysidea avara TaxID=196820 RepID=UPI00331C3D19